MLHIFSVRYSSRENIIVEKNAQDSFPEISTLFKKNFLSLVSFLSSLLGILSFSYLSLVYVQENILKTHRH